MPVFSSVFRSLSFFYLLPLSFGYLSFFYLPLPVFLSFCHLPISLPFSLPLPFSNIHPTCLTKLYLTTPINIHAALTTILA